MNKHLEARSRYFEQAKVIQKNELSSLRKKTFD